MKQVFDSARRVFVHDFDGVHYAYSDFSDLNDYLAKAKVTAAAELLPDLDYDTALTMGRDSFHKTGNGQMLFVLHAEKLGMNVDDFKRDFHFVMHKHAAAAALADRAHIFAPHDAINGHFDSMRGKVRHGLLTQSCLTNWAKPFLTTLNRLQYFEETALFGYAEAGFLTKAESTQPLEKIIDALQAQAEEVIFIEDSLPNLQKAKELDARILTVYTGHGKPLDTVPDYVDIETSSLDSLFTQARKIYGA